MSDPSVEEEEVAHIPDQSQRDRLDPSVEEEEEVAHVPGLSQRDLSDPSVEEEEVTRVPFPHGTCEAILNSMNDTNGHPHYKLQTKASPVHNSCAPIRIFLHVTKRNSNSLGPRR